MQEIFGYTDELCKDLEKEDEDIVHAVELVDDTKYYLEALRTDVGCDDFLTNVTSFCKSIRSKLLIWRVLTFPLADLEGVYLIVRSITTASKLICLWVSLLGKSVS